MKESNPVISKRKTNKLGRQACKQHHTPTKIIYKIPSVRMSLLNKYYYPAIHQQNKLKAASISNFLNGNLLEDFLEIGQVVKMNAGMEYLQKYNERAIQKINSIIFGFQFQRYEESYMLMHYSPVIEGLLRTNFRNKRQYFANKIVFRKQIVAQSPRSPKIIKKDDNLLKKGSAKKTKPQLSETSEFSKLSKCIKKLFKNTKSKLNFNDIFISMKKIEQPEISQARLQLIQNLQKDFSSICGDTKPTQQIGSNYGLDVLKKKFESIPSNINITQKTIVKKSGLGSPDFFQQKTKLKQSKAKKPLQISSTKKLQTSNPKGKRMQTGTSETPDYYDIAKMKNASKKKPMLPSSSANPEKATLASHHKEERLDKIEKAYYPETPSRKNNKNSLVKDKGGIGSDDKKQRTIKKIQ